MNIFLFTLSFTLLILPFYIKFLIKIGSVQANFQNKLIPVSFGIFIFFIETIVMLIYQPINDIGYIWLSLLAISIVGFYDDLYGDKKIKGLKGHFSSTVKGKPTTGFLKAVIGGIVSIFISFKISSSLLEIVTHFLLIALMINMINLFDLRPGRALKVFFILYLLLGVGTMYFFKDVLGLILFAILLVVFINDIRAKIMLGDSGSNLIGIHLGIWYSNYTPLFIQWLLIFTLLTLHIYTEKYSLNQLIEKYRFLKKIDLWGRKGMY